MERITTLLKEHKSIDGVSLFEHISQLLHKILHEPNKYSTNLEFIELLSDFVKKNQFKYKNPKSDKEVNNIPVVVGEHQEWIEQCLKLFNETKKLPRYQNILFPNLLQDAAMLEWTNINFGEEETYRIHMSIRKLAQQSKATQIRFWGKILAKQHDYYVVEGVTPNEFADKLPAGSEPKGEGANFYTFWVSHNVLEDWFELPLVTPDQIKAARQIKYIFTGDLNSEVKSWPRFPGKEKHLLKAQIVRISCGTVLAPKGLYKLNEETKKLEFEDEPYKLPEYAELKALESWVHLHPCLLNLGRTTHWVDNTLTAEQQAQVQEDLTNNDPEVERLKEIAGEKSPYPPAEEGQEDPNWVVKETGDLMQYNTLEGGTACYGTIVFKNLTWPGSYTVVQSKGWCNVYVGYGLKVNQVPFNPIQPDDILDEQDDVEEFREPNPDKPIEVLEPDSDKEKKDGEEGNAEGEEQ